MGNMSYCRFRNTLYDLQDCTNAIESGELTDEGIDSSELSALMEMRDLCEYFVENLSEEINEIYETFHKNK